MMDSLAFAARLGVVIVGLVLAGLGSGYLIDLWFGTKPLFFLFGGIVGIVFSLWAIFKLTEDFREPIFKKKKK